MEKTPLLTIIVPHYNMQATLPRLLDSILAQTPIDLEVVLVDDGSHLSCADIVAAYSAGGLNVRLVELGVNRGTMHACLTGVTHARGRMVAFASADDFLHGTESLARATRLFLREQPDIVHCNTLLFDREKQCESLWLWGGPLAPRLEGKAIFAAYVRSGLKAHSLSDKVFSRDIWNRILEKSKKFNVRFEGEDFLFLSLLFAECRKYIGSDIVFHHYFFTPQEIRTLRSPMYVNNIYNMLVGMLPFLRESQFSQEIIAEFERTTCRKISAWLKIVDQALCSTPPDGSDHARMLSAVRTVGRETFERAADRVLRVLGPDVEKENILRRILNHLEGDPSPS